MKIYTQEDVIGMIWHVVEIKHSTKKAAENMGLAPEYLSQILHGKRPGPAVLDYFGLRKADLYISALGEKK